MPSLVLVHTVFGTANRVPCLAAETDDVLLHILGQRAKALGSHLVVGGCFVDHVHLLLRLGPSASLATLMQSLKGGGAFELNRHPRVRRRVEWQRGYWATSIAPENVQVVAAYVRTQREHHDPSHPLERGLRHGD